jgi:nitrile hydratase accessory protein
VTSYRPNRNIVRRHLDGKAVNVARARGQIFVCANACCCGREDLTNAAVPTALYHDEWTRRRLRNFVHLTIGGCLGPCALANVAMLLFDGRSRWFHSMNGEAAIVALFDYVESLLDAGAFREADGLLAEHTFTGYEWEARPDGAPVEDRRRWRGRALRPEATPACELAPGDLQVMVSAAAVAEEPSILRAVDGMAGAAALPRSNGELAFGAPWEGRAFGMAAALSDAGLYDWDAFRARLIEQIAANERSGEPFDYYANWLRAFEALLTAEGIVSPEELAERTAEFEFGERAEVF